MEIAYTRCISKLRGKMMTPTSALLLSLMPDHVYHYLPRVSS